MIRKLRIKFVCVIMAVVMVLLSGILGVVVWFTGKSVEMQNLSIMRTVAANPLQQSIPGKNDGEDRLLYFTVQISSRGELIADSSGDFDLSDREYVQQIINSALRSDQESGKLEEYDLRYLKMVSPVGFTIVFSDTTGEDATMRQFVYSCLGILLLAAAVFLGISILLSHWAIKPVAKAWKQQRQFVADASHELKTPLSVIMANAELMQNEDTGEADRVRYSGNILGMTYQMRTLVENMLEMARVDGGTVKQKITTLDLSQLVRDAALSFQLLYEEKGMGLRCAVAENIYLQGSEQHLFQLMDVLLDNALKYATPESMVSVELVSTGRNCLLSVASFGEPLSQEERKNIFKRFYRGDKARTMNGSYGLGLSIAESIVEDHKGKIWASSADGQNIFYVQLPTARSM